MFFVTCVHKFSQVAIVRPILSRTIVNIKDPILRIPLHVTSNGQVERFDITLSEIVRCLKIERKTDEAVDLILQATNNRIFCDK